MEQTAKKSAGRVQLDGLMARYSALAEGVAEPASMLAPFTTVLHETEEEVKAEPEGEKSVYRDTEEL